MFRWTLLLLAGGLIGRGGPGVAQTTVPVDVHAGYLHVDSNDAANAAAPISLAALGLAPGNTIRIESVGDWNNGPGGDIYTTMMGVFSGSATLLDPSLLHRVADAIDAGPECSTCCTWPSNEPMDIAEDFPFENPGLTVTIPAGATHLFVSTRDNYFRDNSDPDGDCAVKITLVSPTAVGASAASLALSAYPNPLNPLTTIALELPVAGAVQLTIYDAMGRMVRRLADQGIQTAGRHEAIWDGRSDRGTAMPSGVYLCRLEAGGFAQTIKLALMK